MVVYWKSGPPSALASLQKRYGPQSLERADDDAEEDDRGDEDEGEDATPLRLFCAEAIRVQPYHSRGLRHRRIKAPPLGDAGEYSRCVTEELHSKAVVLRQAKVRELALQLPSFCVGDPSNLWIGGRPGDLLETMTPEGRRRLYRVVENPERSLLFSPVR